ncbi:MAG: hypothetical protein A2122_00900 [Candidatus Liptonbacteria bacterium GWB1_49_6]|uniref:Reverse transcriptase domain-containing protein n=1 Tax=Candidatus Liptonbacteria bacterium GWB1_49_6 TaxID=1798644 RepID=A0A1G2C5I4_9BACT|nr:MAG: hypothetical protein A2122_00900 [Candidatus Liptonbacteria bacterium GWB1_49_6]
MIFLKKAHEKTCDELPLFFPRLIRRQNQKTGAWKIRRVYEPNDAMRAIHEELDEYLRSQPRFPKHAPPRPAENVAPHRGNRFFYLTDIENAFGSVKVDGLVKAFCLMNSFWIPRKRGLKNFLENYCIAPEGGLYQGAPSSPALFELYAWAFLERPIHTWYNLKKWCGWNDVTYTRYVDDLTFSSKKRIGRGTRRQIRRLLHNAEFTINNGKNFVIDLANPKTPRITITGIGLEYGGRMFVSRERLRELEKMLIAGIEGEDVNPHKIEGFMSVFWSPYGGKRRSAVLTRTQRRILSLSRAWRKLQKKNHTMTP